MKPPLDDPRRAELRAMTGGLAYMAAQPVLFCLEEVLGQCLAATAIAFDLAGVGEEETARRSLFQALHAYIDPQTARADIIKFAERKSA